MSISNFEQKVALDLEWQSVKDIPSFPLSSFEDVKQQIEKNKFSIGIDFTTANQLAEYLYGKGHAIFFWILASTPFLITIASLVLTFILGNYWLLLGIVLSFVGQFMSNPYNPFKNYLKPLVGTLFLAFLYGLWKGNETLAYLSAFFVFPFLINEYLYSMNQTRLEGVALKSEKIFIFLYQSGKLGLKDNLNQRMYWYKRESD